MPSYTFRCRTCDATALTTSNETIIRCCMETMARDYKADAPNLNLATCRKARA